MKKATYLTFIRDVCARTGLTRYSVSLAVLACQNIVGAGVTTSIKMALKSNSYSRGYHPANNQTRLSWPPCHLPRNKGIITLLVIGHMPFCQYESARLLIGNAGIMDTAQFRRDPFILETKVFVESSYGHDEEDVARPSLSQTVAVIRPHSRVSQYGYVVRNKTHMCSCCS